MASFMGSSTLIVLSLLKAHINAGYDGESKVVMKDVVLPEHNIAMDSDKVTSAVINSAVTQRIIIIMMMIRVQVVYRWQHPGRDWWLFR